MDYEFAVGDWVFCDRKLVQIQKVECRRVTSVSDGSFIHCGFSLRCYPLTMHTKRATDTATFWEDQLPNCLSSNGLNWPDISSKLTCLWSLMCEAPEGEDSTELRVLAESNFSSFVQEVNKHVSHVHQIDVDGVKIFR